MCKHQVLVQIGENCNRDARNVGTGVREESREQKSVYEWFKRFREGKETTEDEPHSGQPSTSRTQEMIEKVRLMLAQDRQLMVRLIVKELGISKARTRRIPSSAIIWVSGRSAPDLCRTSSQTSRKQNGWKLLETSFPCVTRIHCFHSTGGLC